MSRTPEETDHNIYLMSRVYDPGEGSEPLVPQRGRYIVQFTKPLTQQERERLQRTYRLRLSRYIHSLAYLEYLTPDMMLALSEEPLRRATTPYHPADKIAPELTPYRFAAARSDDRPGLLIRAVLFSDFDESTELKREHIEAVVRAIGGLIDEDPRESTPGAERRPDVERETGADADGESDEEETRRGDAEGIRVIDDRDLGGQVQVIFTAPSAESLRSVARLDEVYWLEEVVVADEDSNGPNTVAGVIQSGRAAARPLWERGINGEGQTIGFIEFTRVDAEHCMFRDPDNPIGSTHRKIASLRHAGAEGQHATSVAGIAVGDSFSNSGKGEHRGIAWAAKMTMDDYRFVRSRNVGMLRLLHMAAADGATIHSNSWHDPVTHYNQTAFDADAFVWNNEEHFVCGAAGNLNESLGPPGTAKNVLCVSAGLAHPSHLTHADGPSGPIILDGRRKPEVCAPGCGITSALVNVGNEPSCGTSPVQNCASSWATPVIAGAAALTRQYFLEGWFPMGTKVAGDSRRPSAALIKACLLNSTVPMVPANNYPSNQTGWGMVNLTNTLFFAGSPLQLFVEDVRNADGLDTGDSRVHHVDVGSGSRPLKITLVWSDFHGQNTARFILTNELNLTVTGPDGMTYHGNVNFSGGFSQPTAAGGAHDGRNNVEMVVINNPTEGTWLITVSCRRAPTALQGYALVATHGRP